jgi:hypothetical protein
VVDSEEAYIGSRSYPPRDHDMARRNFVHCCTTLLGENMVVVNAVLVPAAQITYAIRS